MNTLIHQNPQEVSKIIDILGSSSVVGVIEVDTRSSIPTSAYEMSRQSSGLDLDQTIKKYLNLGVGEIVLTDVGRDGCYTGLNKDFIEIVKKYKYEAPFLISGGFFKKEEIEKFINVFSGIIISSVFHFEKLDVKSLIEYIKNKDNR